MGSRGQRVWQEVTKTSACCFAPAGSWGLGSPHKVPESLLSRLLAGGPSCPEGRGVPFSRGTGRGWSQEASEGTCWAATGKMVLLPWPEGFVPRGGHSGLACSARTPRSLSASQGSCVLCPSVPVLQMGMQQMCQKGQLPHPRVPSAPVTAQVWAQRPWYLISNPVDCKSKWKTTMGTGRTVQMVLGASPLLSARAVARGPGAGADSGRAGLPATGSWAEGLTLQVNLLTWWLWMAAGETGSTEELRRSLRHLGGRGAAEWARGERRAMSPAQLHPPPWGSMSLVGETVLGSPTPRTGAAAGHRIWPVQGGLHQRKAPASCLGTEMWSGSRPRALGQGTGSLVC